MTTPSTNDAAADEQLSAYLDGELEPSEIEAFERRLEADPALRAELEALERVVGMLKVHGPASAPEGFHARVMARVEAEHPAPSFWDWLRRPFGLPIEGLAVAVAVAVVLWFALPRPGTDPTLPPDDAATPAAAAPRANEIAGLEAAPEGEAGTDAVAVAEPVAPEADKMGAEPQRQRPEAPASTSAKSVKLADAGADAAPEPAAPAEATAGGTDEAPAAPALKSAGYAYTMYSESPTALVDLIRVANKHGGSVHDANDVKLRDGALTSSQMQLYVHLPQGAAMSRFVDDLRAISYDGRLEKQGDPELTYRTDNRIGVTLNVIGGSVGDEPSTAPKASRKARAREADVLDALELK